MRFSTRAMPSRGHATVSHSSPPGFDPVVHAEVQQAKRRWERCASATSAWMPGSSPGMTKKRTKEIRRRNADRRNGHILPWLTATAAPANGRRTSIGVPPRFSSQGVFHRKGLSTRLLLTVPLIGGVRPKIVCRRLDIRECAHPRERAHLRKTSGCDLDQSAAARVL